MSDWDCRSPFPPSQVNNINVPHVAGKKPKFKVCFPVDDYLFGAIEKSNHKSELSIFGDGAFKEVVKVKQGHKGEVLIQLDWCPYEKR